MFTSIFSCPVCRRELIPPVPSVEALEAQSDEALQTQLRDIIGRSTAIDVNLMSKNEMAVMIHAHMVRKHHQEESEDLLEEERRREEALGLEPRVTSSSVSSTLVDPLQSATNLQTMIEAESRSRHSVGGVGSGNDLSTIERMLDTAAAPLGISSSSSAVNAATSSSSMPSNTRERDYEEFSDFIQAMASGNASQYENSLGEEVNDTDTMFPGGIMIRSHRDARRGNNLMSYSVHPTSLASPGGNPSRMVLPTTTTVMTTRTSETGMGANDSMILSTQQSPSALQAATRNDLESID